MLIQVNAISSGTNLEADLCILGAGPAGMTIAHRLRTHGISIVLLVSGDKEFDSRAQALNEGENIGLDYLALDSARLRMLGGSSNHWEGSCNDFDEIDFAVRPWVPDSGWPFPKAELTPYYALAQNYLELGPYEYDLSFWTHRLKLEWPIWLKDGLEGCVTHHSPPTRFGEVYGSDLEEATNIRLLLGATALSMELGTDRRVAERVVVGRFGADNIAVRARRFVVAMGGIENARFLLLNGIGNEYDLVGRFFMEHPFFRLMVLAPSPSFIRSYTELSKGIAASNYRITPCIKFSDEILHREEFQNCRIAFERANRFEIAAGIESFHELGRVKKSPEEIMYHIGNLILDIDMLAEAASRRSLGTRILPSASDVSLLSLGCMTEQLPNPDSRITLGHTLDDFGQRRSQLALRLSDADKIAAGRFSHAISRIFGQVGIGRVRNLIADRFAPWPPRKISYGSHHVGTTRMNPRPTRGVVDENLRIHSLSNVYVAGSSVFPTAGHVPPTLTIVALSLRLADHLKAHAYD